MVWVRVTCAPQAPAGVQSKEATVLTSHSPAWLLPWPLMLPLIKLLLFFVAFVFSNAIFFAAHFGVNSCFFSTSGFQGIPVPWWVRACLQGRPKLAGCALRDKLLCSCWSSMRTGTQWHAYAYHWRMRPCAEPDGSQRRLLCLPVHGHAARLQPRVPAGRARHTHCPAGSRDASGLG